MTQIRDSVVMGDVNIGQGQLRCPSCNAEGSITIFTCIFEDCSSKFCQHCSPRINKTVCLKHLSRYDAIIMEQIRSEEMKIKNNILKYQLEHNEKELQFQKELFEIRKNGSTQIGNPENSFWLSFIALIGFWIVVIYIIIYLIFFI